MLSESICLVFLHYCTLFLHICTAYYIFSIIYYILLSVHHGKIVDYTHKVVRLVEHEQGVNLVSLLNALYVGDFRVRADSLRVASHDVAHGVVEELGLPALRGTTYVAIGNEAHDATIFYGDSQSQLALADEDDGLAEVHLWRYDGQVVLVHHVLRRGEQAPSQFAAGMVVSKVLWLKVS